MKIHQLPVHIFFQFELAFFVRKLEYLGVYVHAKCEEKTSEARGRFLKKTGAGV
jgi:hypothetical protein